MNNDVSLIVTNVPHISTYREPAHEVRGNCFLRFSVNLKPFQNVMSINFLYS